MQVSTPAPLGSFQTRVVDYLPTLTAGLVVLGLGIAAGWVAKRAVVRALLWLRLDRLGSLGPWRGAFSKGDVRSALYDVAGNIVMALVILVFLDNALEIWGLAVLSRMVERVLAYLPNVALATLIGGVGVLFARALADRVRTALEEENVTRARLAAKVFHGALLFVVGALALWELQFGREIVLAAFLIAFGAVGVAFALGAGLGSARAIQHAIEDFLNRSDKTPR
jgi:hypothetical protein